MRNIFLRITNWRYSAIVAAGLLGALVCMLVYGASILNPTNTSWLYADGDITQHQLGWEFFRNDSWHLPLGTMKTLAYPEGTSVVYMDSIPLAAISFKALSPILPHAFQYFGLWGLLSFVLQGALGALIVRRFTKSNLLAILGSLFFVFAPFFLMRTYAHTALASQFIILIGICFVLYRDHFKSPIKSVAAWASLLAISAAIHPYFVPMSGILLLIYLILKKASWKSFVLHLAIGGIVALGCFWLVGGFVTKNVGTDTLGMFGADVNALINPINFSYFIKPLPTISGAYEGLAYLGLGVYLLLFLVVMWFFFSYRWRGRMSLKSVLKNNIRPILAGAVILSSIALAIGPVAYLNGHNLITVSPPTAIANVLSIFRSSGRFMWIASYFLLIVGIGGVIYAAKKLKVSITKVAIIFLILLGVQIVDVIKSEGMATKRHTIISSSRSAEYVNRFNTPAVQDLLAGKKHVAYTSDSLHDNNFFEIGPLITARSMTVNDGYISRKPAAAVDYQTGLAYNELNSDNLRPDTVYISDAAPSAKSANIKTIQIGDTYLSALK